MRNVDVTQVGLAIGVGIGLHVGDCKSANRNDDEQSAKCTKDPNHEAYSFFVGSFDPTFPR